MSISLWLDSSVVSSLFDVLGCLSWELSVPVEVKVLLFNWVHGIDNIPVHSLCARRSCDWALVHPPIVSVNTHDQFSVVDFGCNGVKFTTKNQGINEIINDFDLVCCDTFIVVRCVENDTKSCSHKSISFFAFRDKMDCVHFKVKKLSINRMLRLGMNMELRSVELDRCSILFIAKVRFEISTKLCITSQCSCFCIDSHLGCRFIGNPWNSLSVYVGVEFREISCTIYLSSVCLEVDWALGSSFTIWECFSPVISVCCVINRCTIGAC